ncbi:MAG TPA: ATP-binding protein [Kofleriaceae bacterium]|nr:ATP-binding protein [Kofleriaceae bacterium]
MLAGYFSLQLRRVRLAARLAVARSGIDVTPDLLAATQTELAEVETTLAHLRTESNRRDARLAGAMGLTDDQLDFLWGVVARAVDPLLLALLQPICGTEVRKGLAIAHYATIMGLGEDRAQGIADLVLPSHPMRRHRFLIAEEAAIDVCTPVTVPARVWSFLRGDDEPEELIRRAGGRIVLPFDAKLDDVQRAAVHRIDGALNSFDRTVVVIEGPAASGRRTAVALAAANTARSVIAIDVTRVAPGALDATLSAQIRECMLEDALPVIAEVDELMAREGEIATGLRAVARAIEEAPGPIAVTSRMPGLNLGIAGRRVVRVRWPVPAVASRRELWLDALGEDAKDLPHDELDEVALRYRLGAGGITGGAAAARALREARDPTSKLTLHDVQEGIRNNIAERLGDLATRVEIHQTWDDLVLPTDTLDDVNALIARVKHAHQVYEKWGFKQKMPRGIGVAALFSGPPGTGKTMVAGLLARELDLELYQIDLSKVVSKWVGETEKQLAKIFEAADAGHALLLFDEADSLFAKRTEVKSAVDRYANLEVNFLLQRIESFGGITILTTNLDTSIDPALKRRLASHIVFQAPELTESMKLWERMLVAQAPFARPLELEKLARSYEALTGANIRHAVLAAAFSAASEGSAISQAHLERAARGEYRAMGRVLR